MALSSKRMPGSSKFGSQSPGGSAQKKALAVPLQPSMVEKALAVPLQPSTVAKGVRLPLQGRKEKEAKA